MPGQIPRTRPLHDHDQRPRLLGIEPVGKNLGGETQHLVALDITLDVLQIMRILIAENIRTKTSQAMHRARQPLPAFVVVVMRLEVLRQLKPIAPMILIPRRLDQFPALDAVLSGQLGVITQIGKSHPRPHPGLIPYTSVGILARRIRVLCPHPRWKEYVQPHGLIVPWWNVDQQPQNLPVGHRLQMLAHALDVPVIHEPARLTRPAPARMGIRQQRILTGAKSLFCVKFGKFGVAGHWTKSIGMGPEDINRHPVIHTWSYKLAEAPDMIRTKKTLTWSFLGPQHI
jgi:hypothetical protein